MTPLQKKLLPPILIVLGVFISLVIIEVALRIAGVEPFPDYMRDFVAQSESTVQRSSNPDRYYEFVPNKVDRIWDTEVSINSHGFRGAEIPEKKSVGTHRVAMIGDSITFGYWIPGDKTFSRQLQDLLQKGGINAEVLNLGVNGYDTIAAVATLEDVGRKYEVDTVIYTMCINDLAIHSGELAYFESFLPALEKPIVRWSGGLRIVQWLSLNNRRMATAWNKRIADDDQYLQFKRGNALPIAGDEGLAKRMDALREKLSTINQKNPPFPWIKIDPMTMTHLQAYTSDIRIGHFEAALQALKKLQEEHHYNVAVEIVPFLDTETYELWKPAYDIVEYEVEKYGFDLIPLGDTLHAAGLDSLRHESNMDYLHPVASKQHLIAKQLAVYVEGVVAVPPEDAAPEAAEAAAGAAPAQTTAPVL